MKKRIIIGLLSIVLIALVIASIFLENIVKKAIHKYGSQITGTEVSLEGFELSPLSGRVAIRGLSVANPEKYTSPELLNLGGVSVKVNLSSLLTDTIVIDYIKVDKPVITYEMMSLTQNNIKQLQANIAQNTSSSQPAPVEDKKTSSKSSKRIIIKEVSIREGKLKAVAKTELIDVKLPEINLTNIGASSKKESAGIISSVTTILNKLLSTASEVVIQNGLNNLKDVAEKNLDKVVGGVKDKIKNIGIFGK